MSSDQTQARRLVHRVVRYTAVATLAALLASRMAVAPIAGQSQPREGARTFQSWVNAVTTHVPGELDEPATAIAPWSFAELVAVFPELRNRSWTDRSQLIERGLVLHADIAILNRNASGYNLPAGVGNATLLDDGSAVGQMASTVHWDVARRLINEIPERLDRVRIGRSFYRASGAVLQQWGEYPELTLHLAAGRKVLGDDPVLLLYEGTMRQAYAGPRMQRFFDERRRAEEKGPVTMRSLPPGAGGTIPELPPSFPSIRESRSQAERLFRRALNIDPTLSEARIRLAHLLGDGGRHMDAATELRRLTTGQLPRFLDYYASLVTARTSRARGQLDAARAAFEHAATVYPHAPAPRLGLSELTMAQGKPAESLAQLVSFRTEPPQDAPSATEPWWWIDRVHEPSADALMSDLRQAAAR